MAKYRKKPIVIEAVQWTGINSKEIAQFNAYQNWKLDLDDMSLAIPTSEGTMIASKEDWIIKGINGEFYPCKPDVFEKTYELVEE